jgi:glycosyltransferase involved in cell wall biosynthesis
MQRSFIGLDPLPDRYDFLATINNKAIEYLSAGLPIISSPDKGVLFQLLEKNQCGISYPAGDSDSLAAHLLILYNNRGLLQTMSDKAVMIFREKFTAEHVNADMMRYLEEIISIYGKKSV